MREIKGEKLQGIAEGASSSPRLANSLAALFSGRNESPDTLCSLIGQEEREDNTNQQSSQRGSMVSNPVWIGSKWLLAFPRAQLSLALPRTIAEVAVLTTNCIPPTTSHSIYELGSICLQLLYQTEYVAKNGPANGQATTFRKLDIRKDFHKFFHVPALQKTVHLSAKLIEQHLAGV